MARLIPATGQQRVPVLVWSGAPPKGALAQLERIASQPYVVGQVAGMPDLHVAEGISVGTVFATERHVVPGALGGDLGCGVAALRFDPGNVELSNELLRRILAAWLRLIPTGDALRRGAGLQLDSGLLEAPLSTRSLEHARERLVPRHFGTLGGGNHFLELDRSVDGELWLLVHTGSRGLGSAIAAHHLAAARAEGQGEPAGLAIDTDAGQSCLRDLRWAFDFAEANRSAVLREAARALEEQAGMRADGSSRLDVRHNFVALEQHSDRRLWVHRKGAIAAEPGRRLLIPGSMGTASYLVEGLGETSSFRSASHGAGRVMTRSEARKRIAPSRLARSMRRVVHDERRAASLVEEAPEAYRDIREVLEEEADLVVRRERLEPLLVLKG